MSKCGREMEVYSRVSGYMRPLQNWNDGKKEEFKNRLMYDVKKSLKQKSYLSSAAGGGQ